MALLETLNAFVGAIAVATTDAPDEYPSWSDGYQAHMADLKGLWAKIRPQLKYNLDEAAFVDAKLQEMVNAFEAGNKAAGRAAAWSLYNADVGKLR